MADLAELKQMVLSFRVSELHVLLGFAGRNKSGRKQELTQRALGLVQKGCSLPVQIKIRELYRQIYPAVTKTSAPQNKDPNMYIMHRQNGMVGYPQGSHAGVDYGALGSMRPMIPNQAAIPVNPDVQLKRLPFYDILGDLMKPASLIPTSSTRMQEKLFVFHLTPQQAHDITMSRDFRPGAKCEYTVQVQVRFCLLETTCEQDDTFPSQIQVRVNNKPATLPPKPLPLHNKAPPKKYGCPVNITTLCRINPMQANKLHVYWELENSSSFCMSIYLVRKLSSDILLSRLKTFGNRHSDHTRALIKEKLAQDPDSEISFTSLRVSLMCPLGKMRMQIPCRASICSHLQCFDASTYLMMNERKPTWLCPVCNKSCPYDKLIIDGYFVEIFQQAPTCSDICFHGDGSWSPMKPQENSQQVILTPNKGSGASPAALSLPPSPPQVSATVTTAATTSAAAASSAPAGTNEKSNAPVIDLTLDTSDEDEDDDDAIIPADPSPPVINLDTPSPAPLSSVPSSPPAPPPYTSSFNKASSRSSPDSLLQPSSSLATPSPSSTLQTQALNLEAMSDADFDEFLKGLSWGV